MIDYKFGIRPVMRISVDDLQEYHIMISQHKKVYIK